jgi:hypothetical protein
MMAMRYPEKPNILSSMTFLVKRYHIYSGIISPTVSTLDTSEST